jgi:hypothetical protein
MTEIMKLITRPFKVACLITVDLLAFYTSLFIAWIVRSDLMP